MEIAEDGVRFPAALEADAFETDSADEEGHGSSRAERTCCEVLAADIQVRHHGKGSAKEGRDVLSLQRNGGTMLVDGTEECVTGGAKLA